MPKRGDYTSARSLLNSVLQIEQTQRFHGIAVLLIPKVQNRELIIEEHWTKEMRDDGSRENIQLAEAANATLEALGCLLSA